MKPNTRAHFSRLAFLPKARTIDRRAEWYLKQIHALTQDVQSESPRPLWPLALAALILWGAVLAAVVFLAHSYGWIA